MAQGAGYSFNPDTITGTTVRDLAGYFLHGSILGSAALTAGKYSDGLNCTGGAMRVVVAADTYPVNTDGGLSIGVWVKLNTTTAAARCAVSAASSGVRDWALYASNSSGNVEARIESATYSTSTSIRDGGWHHLLLVVDKTFGPGGESVRLVVDGATVLTSTGLTTGLSYTGATTMEAGRNAASSAEALDGIVDDLRWWNDPIESAYWPTIIASEQPDLQMAIYPFGNDATDQGSYGRHLSPAPSASYTYGMYGRALVSTAAAAGASGAVNLPDCDRLAFTGWVRLDVTPSGSPAPILAIDDAAGNSRVQVVVNTDRTVTATWVTISYGTRTVTSPTTLTVGQWTRVHISMNPTYVGIRIGTVTQTTTSTGNTFPYLAPTVDNLAVLYVGGDKNGGGQVTWDYLTLTKNFLNEVEDPYWSGPPTVRSSRPLNIARGVYDFNENTGSSIADKSPVGNTLTRTAAGSWVTGVQGSALGSNGTGGGASGTITWPASPKGWAFSAWVKCRTSPSGARFLVMRNAGSEVAHAGRLSGNLWTRLYGAGGNTGAVSVTSAPIPAETWTHVAAVCNGVRTQFFLNGRRVTALDYSVGALLVPTTLVVGGDNPDDSVADVDDLRVFDTPVSAADIAWMYQHPSEFYDTGFEGWGLPL